MRHRACLSKLNVHLVPVWAFSRCSVQRVVVRLPTHQTDAGSVMTRGVLKPNARLAVVRDFLREIEDKIPGRF